MRENMGLEGICFQCFQYRGDYEVCPHCGYVAGTLPREAYLLNPGTILASRFVVGVVLGVGGFGATYKAWDTKLGIVIAIKEFYPGGLVSRIPGETRVRLFSGDKETNFKKQLDRFLDEARNMARFTGEKNIVNVFDFFEENNTAYIVMEFLDGLTLKEYIQEKGGSIPVPDALVIMESVLKAVGSIHQKSIIHRDISPDNIFILKDGSVKVLDFGAARFAVAENPEFTQSIVIKVGYAPPEQYRSNMKQGVWTDIYALGATFYKMITGVTPEESIDRMEKDTLKRPSALGVRLESYAEKTVMKAMALKPELRFKSVEQMGDALKNRTGAEFPEEELKKRKQLRGAAIVLAVAFILGMGAYAGYESTRQGKPTLADLAIEKEHIVLGIPGESGERAIYEELIQAFMKTYPGYEIVVGEEDADVFLCTDGIKEVELADLTFLLDSLDTDDYWLLNKYETYYPKKDRIPVSFDFYTVFADEIAVTEAGGALPAALGETELRALQEKAGTESVYEDWASTLRRVQAEWPGHYKVIPYEVEGTARGQFCQEFAINGRSEEGKQQVGMLFLHFLLSEYAQNYACVQQDSYVPLNKKAFAQYVEINQDFGFLASQVKQMEKKGLEGIRK